MQRVSQTGKGNSVIHEKKTKVIAGVKNRALSCISNYFQKYEQKNKKKCFRTVILPETNSQTYYLHKENPDNTVRVQKLKGCRYL